MNRDSHGESNRPTRERQRLLSLDVFRGLTIAAMILVNNPGSRHDRYDMLAHADWHGWTPTDLIFPFFLFIVGTSIAFSQRKYLELGTVAPTVYLRIVRRTIVLFALGLLLNLFDDSLAYVFGDASLVSTRNLRLSGVLQRIALVYFATSLIVLHLGIRIQATLAAAILAAYWTCLGCFPDPQNYGANLTPDENIVRIVDRTLIGDSHLFTHSGRKPTDPEGLLSTFPAVVTALLGYWAGRLVQRHGRSFRSVGWLIVAGAASAALGLAWGNMLPLNKRIWTSSFVMFSGGFAMIAFALCLWSIDVAACRRLGRPFEIIGVNAIVAYVASHMFAQWLSTSSIDGKSLRAWFVESPVLPWLTDPRLASLAFAVAVVILFWLVLWVIARRGWSARI